MDHQDSLSLVIFFIHIEYICQHQPPNSSHPLTSPWCPRLFSMSGPLFLPCEHLYHFSRFHIYALINSICFSLSDLLYSVWQTLGPSTSPQVAQFLSFSWLSNILSHICTISCFIHSLADRHVACCHNLAIVNSAAMNTGVRVFFNFLFSRYMRSSGIAWSYDRFIPSVLRNHHTALWASPVVKNLSAVQELRDMGFNPWARKIPWRRAWQVTTVFLLKESHGQRSLANWKSMGS